MTTFTRAGSTITASAAHPVDWWLWKQEEEEDNEYEFRFLQSSNSTATDEFNDSQVLRHTFLVYGSALLFIVLLFCWLRLKFPRAYNLRSGWIEALKSSSEGTTPSSPPPPCPSLLAQNQHKFFSWIWKLYVITDDELLNECGLDALCLVRIMQMGYRLSVVGMFNALWLMPLYATAEVTKETENITDSIVKMTTAHVPSGSMRLIGTAIAAYVFFGYVMHQIVEEFAWFIEMRHKYLRKPMARNYAIFVRNIPSALLSNQKVEEFFRGCFPRDSILEARLAMQVSNLAKVEAKRDATLKKLEHVLATYFKNPNGPRPTHKTISLRNIHSAIIPGGGVHQVDSIDAYQKELRELNQDVSRRITELEHVANGTFHLNSNNNNNNQYQGAGADPVSSITGEADLETPSLAMVSELSAVPEDAASLLTNDQMSGPNNVTAETIANSTMTATPTPTSIVTKARAMFRSENNNDQNDDNNNNNNNSNRMIRTVSMGLQDITGKVGNLALTAVDDIGNVTGNITGNITSTAAALLALNNENGQVQSAGFVTFTKLSTTNAAKQMILHQTPFAMEVIEAPDPEDVYWPNVARTHKDLQLGMLSSLAMSTALCLFWTIPMAFISSLSSVSALRNQLPALDTFLTTFPFFEPILEQLAPLMVVGINALLPTILEFVTDFEGPISSAMVAASLFVKLAAFMIIQTFFINALTGGLFQEIHNIIENPTSVVELLAKSLPAQSTYFCQIVFVATVTSAAMELLRIVPLLMALLRQCIGPRLTEKERQTSSMGLRPLCDPQEFSHADFTSQSVLYFMVLLVYAVISPITSFVIALCFLVMGSIFRHQFVYIYPTIPDSGGQIWMSFIRTLLPCLIVAELTIVGLLALKKATVAVPLFIPLLVVTILFSFYIRQVHFRVAEFLPTREALKEDLRRSSCTSAGPGGGDDLHFLRGAYTQPELTAEKQVAIPSTVAGFYSNTTSSTYIGNTWMEQERGYGIPAMVCEGPLGDGQQQQEQQVVNETGVDEGETQNSANNDSLQSGILSSVWGMTFFSTSKITQ